MVDPNGSNPAPAPGRAPRIVTVDGARYRVHPLPPRQGLRVAFRVVGMLGEPIGGLLSGAGLDLGLADEQGNPVRVGLAQILTSAVARHAFAGRLIDGLSKADPDALGELVDALVVGQVDLQVGGAAWVRLTTPELVDEQIPDPWTLLRLVQESFSASVRPTSAGGDLSAPAATTTTPDT